MFLYLFFFHVSTFSFILLTTTSEGGKTAVDVPYSFSISTIGTYRDRKVAKSGERGGATALNIFVDRSGENKLL